jgi:hypothetical protein
MMNNDNATRQQILAQDEADRAHMSHKMVYLHTTIEQKNTYITTLEAELRDITLQRDAWRKTACASAIAPERLETVELTAEQAAVLAQNYAKSSGSFLIKLDNLGDAHMKVMKRLHDMGLITWHMQGLYWAITPAGRAALVAYRASHESEGE